MFYCQIFFLHLTKHAFNKKLCMCSLQGTQTPVYWYTDNWTAVYEEGIIGNCVSLGIEKSCLKIMSGDFSIIHPKQQI